MLYINIYLYMFCKYTVEFKSSLKYFYEAIFTVFVSVDVGVIFYLNSCILFY